MTTQQPQQRNSRNKREHKLKHINRIHDNAGAIRPRTNLRAIIDEIRLTSTTNKQSTAMISPMFTVLASIAILQLACLVPSCHHHQLVSAAEQSPQISASQSQATPSTPPKPWLRHLRFQSLANRGQVSSPAAAAASAAIAPASPSPGSGRSPINKPITHATGSAIELPTSSIVVAPPATAPHPFVVASASAPAPPSAPAPALDAGATVVVAQAQSTSNSRQHDPSHHHPVGPTNSQNTSNRTTRTADIFQNGDGFNMFVTNTCERESMRINVKTSRPFYGVIHTRDHRQKSGCSVEGSGATEYNLEISQSLLPSDPNYCGALRGARESPQDSEIVSLVVAVRVQKRIELSDDRFFLLNCTNRCRKPDCSSPTNARFTDNNNPSSNGRLVETEGDRDLFANNNSDNNKTNSNVDHECNIYKFPWAVSLLWCLGIMCIALIISHCFLCSSLVCRCVRKEVEEQEPSIYGDGSIVDYDNDMTTHIKNDKDSKSKHPYRIEYDNRDIYKTSNNYDPYCLEDDGRDGARFHQRRAYDYNDEEPPKRRHHKHHSRR